MIPTFWTDKATGIRYVLRLTDEAHRGRLYGKPIDKISLIPQGRVLRLRADGRSPSGDEYPSMEIEGWDWDGCILFFVDTIARKGLLGAWIPYQSDNPISAIKARSRWFAIRLAWNAIDADTEDAPDGLPFLGPLAGFIAGVASIGIATLNPDGTVDPDSYQELPFPTPKPPEHINTRSSIRSETGDNKTDTQIKADGEALLRAALKDNPTLLDRLDEE